MKASELVKELQDARIEMKPICRITFSYYDRLSPFNFEEFSTLHKVTFEGSSADELNAKINERMSTHDLSKETPFSFFSIDYIGITEE